jgi:predicted O-linked N-acetylglucosamine transferase (SPINDLY family)
VNSNHKSSRAEITRLLQAGKYGEATALARKFTASFPDDEFGWRALGWALRQGGRHNESLAPLERAVELTPGNVENLVNLGSCYEFLGRLDAAEATYDKALECDPDSAIAWFNLGNTLFALGKAADAENAFRQALRARPDYAKAWHNLATLLRNRGLSDEAEASYRNAVRANTAYVDALCGLGNVLCDQRRWIEAEAAYRRAIAIRVDHHLAHYNLGTTLRELGRYTEAQACLRDALRIAPGHVGARLNLGVTHQDRGRLEDALACFREAKDADPGHLDARSNLLFALNYVDGMQEEYFREAAEYGSVAREKVRQAFPFWNCREDSGRLRIGLVSGDLREHVVSYFLEDVLRDLDPARFEIHAYPNSPVVDEVSSRIRERCASFKPIFHLGDEAVARLIHEDGIHILIDLSGHTAGNRLPVFAWRPAPLQVTWLGYFASTGLAEMDYFLSDPITVPESQVPLFSEKIWCLPETRLCFSAPKPETPVSPLPALANGFVTFGCFNNLTKVGDPVIDLWAKILKAVPGSRLFLKATQLADPSIALAITERFARAGIEAGRLILEGPSQRREYLSAYHRVDIGLDPFPYTGGATTSESLWMGVPVLTLAGERPISRQGVALLTNAGLTDWIASDADDYVALAVEQAGDLGRLSLLRSALRARVLASPLFDAPRFARHLEHAFSDMWAQKAQSMRAERQLSGPAASVARIDIISATRLSEAEFWKKSALGMSLDRLKHDIRLSVHVAFENRRGLPEVYNERILAEDAADMLVFIHDDVWIDDFFLADRVIDGLRQYDVIGVAGNRRRVERQLGWGFIDDKFTFERSSHLSGTVAQGHSPFGMLSFFGAAPADCELLDGVFIAARKSALREQRVQFDPAFSFHFYDLDFCRSARLRGLRLGTWPIALTHQSRGAFGSADWHETGRAYLEKWRD